MSGPRLHPQWAEGSLLVDDVRLHFYRTGNTDRPPLLLAHGASDNGRCWARVANTLHEHFDIVMLDARNHGRSATAATSPALLAHDLAAAITHLGLERPVVMGHSVGAHTSALLAAQFPGLLSLLVLEDPPWRAEREHNAMPEEAAVQLRSDISAWLGSFEGLPEAEIAALGRQQHPEWSDDDYPAWIESNQQVRVQAVDGLDLDPWAAVVDRIACPTLLVHGDASRDGIVTSVVADRVATRNPYITPAFVDAGHNVRRENFDGFIKVVIDFLANEHPTLRDLTLNG